MGPDDRRLHLGRVLDQAAQLVELVALLDGLRHDVLDEEQLALPHLVPGGVLLAVLVALGDLLVLPFDSVDLGKVDESDMLLAVDLFELEALVDRVGAHDVDPVLYLRQLDLLLLPAVLPHYYFISD